MFARFGIPQTVISDNGLCYSSQEFRGFAHAWDFEHITSSPLYPQSNGLAEKTVQTVKALMDKAHAQRTDPYLSLLEYIGWTEVASAAANEQASALNPTNHRKTTAT
ncbi:hypothetical protein VZT92_026707 [Zoarces viviparus]|uniref:Integrase catalytic domain-containing protein n=1 Tax=Zoarces viviparus TaxID=48416 RepID=A0AAW1DR24_ZOAVI